MRAVIQGAMQRSETYRSVIFEREDPKNVLRSLSSFLVPRKSISTYYRLYKNTER